MKKRPSLSPRQLLLGLIILLLFAALVLALFRYRHDEKQFSRLTHDLFVSEMTSNTLNMHYSLAYPENFGIYRYTPVLPDYDPLKDHETAQNLDQTLTELSHIRKKKLSSDDAYTYDLLSRKLSLSQKLNQYPLYQTPLAPSSGMQTQLPILLAEYTFRCRQDVEDYLALLGQTDRYFQSLLNYEQEKAKAGLSMSTYSLRQVKKQCDTVVTKDALNEGTHFLQTTFEDRIHTLVEQKKISSTDAAKYLAQNEHLLYTVVQPAYEALADGLFLLEDHAGIEPFPAGLASRPEGQDYYCNLLISETGSYRSVEEIKQLLQKTMQEEYQSMRTILEEHPDISEHLKTNAYTQLPCQDADEMLSDLLSRIQKDFPGLPDQDPDDPDRFPQVQVKSVSPDLQEYCAPAFYLTVPLDDTDNNVIYINKRNAPTGLDLYTTLAHEGYPGHLYQTVYNNQDFLNRGENKARKLLWYGGYLEGWALYVEFYGYDYAADLLREQGRSDDALCILMEKHNRSLLLCLYSTLDIMIHYDNASREKIAAYLENFGIYSASTVNAVYNYIADEPCNYLKYYLGYLEILELKKTVGELWQESYRDYDFHRFLLDAGPSDFVALRELLSATVRP